MNNDYESDGPIVPSSEFLFAESEDSKREREQEENQVFNELPIISEVLKRMKQDVEEFVSLRAIPEELYTNPDQFMHIAYGNKEVVKILQREIGVIEALVREYSPEDR